MIIRRPLKRPSFVVKTQYIRQRREKGKKKRGIKNIDTEGKKKVNRKKDKKR